MGDIPDRIDPSGIPTFTGNLELLEQNATGLRGDAGKIRGTGTDTHTEFQKLSAFYQAPEADQLFATTQPVKDTADWLADDLGTVASALEGYASEVRPIVKRLESLKVEAAAFVEDIKDDDDWKYDGDKIEKNADLHQDVSTAVAQFWAAERTAANKITSLVNGGTVWLVDDGSGAKNMYGFSVEDMKKAGEAPWGKVVEEKHHAWEIGHWAKSFVWDGFIVEGVWGTLKGLSGLVGFQGWDTFKQSWKGLGQLATGLTILTIPGGLAVYNALPHGAVKKWADDSVKTTKAVGKSLVAWDEWRKNPGKAAGLVAFNVITTVGTGGVGAATKAGTAGKIAATAGKVGRAVDPMAYIVKAGAAGFGKLPKIGDVTASLKGLTTVRGIDLPDGTIRLPDGQIFDPTSPHMPQLPPGKAGVELPNGVPRLDVPEGSVRMPDGTFIDPDGTIRHSDGTVKQQGEQAVHEPNANDRAALDGEAPSGARVPDGSPTGRPPDTAARVPEPEPAAVGGRQGDDAARVGDDAARVDGNVQRPGSIGDRTPLSPVAHAGNDVPGGGSGPSGPDGPPGSSGPSGPGDGPGPGSGRDVPDSGPGREVPGSGPGREVPGAGAADEGAGGAEPGSAGDDAAREPTGFAPQDPDFPRHLEPEDFGPTGPMSRGGDEERAIREIFGNRAQPKPNDLEKALRNLASDPRGQRAAEILASGRLDGSKGLNDLVSDMSQPSMLSGVIDQLQLGDRLNGSGVNEVSFSVKEGLKEGRPCDMDVFARSADGTTYGYQFKDIAQPKKLFQKISASLTQLTKSDADRRIFVLKTKGTLADLQAANMPQRLQRYYADEKVMFAIRVEDGTLYVPPNGDFYPREV